AAMMRVAIVVRVMPVTAVAAMMCVALVFRVMRVRMGVSAVRVMMLSAAMSTGGVRVTVRVGVRLGSLRSLTNAAHDLFQIALHDFLQIAFYDLGLCCAGGFVLQIFFHDSPRIFFDAVASATKIRRANCRPHPRPAPKRAGATRPTVLRAGDGSVPT